ncbi:hypothetical protein PQ455_13800 [Sphingomonas naphthae]|uniref:C-type lysozyme inhibitor domain-containing protein n=1 Tax=Sphingomonas naphthae TaxID=1813468 RepID=A0ABY7TIR7_9SPHN|nr:hypothetical protein [Sphingomonas naphthae]WCT72701.1 hypothetical protein PQ455_13800 [Sphingomonas naphthae]
MQKTRFIAAAPLCALLVLAACGSKPETTTNAASVEDPALNTADAAPVTLPPAIEASRTYRCKDTSLVYVDFFGDKLTANIRTEKDGMPTKLTAPAVGEAFVTEGFSVGGNAPITNITQPGKPSQSCKA